MIKRKIQTCYGNLFEKNPVILEFIAFHRFFSFEKKSEYGMKKEEIDKILVKVEFNVGQ